MYDLDPASLEYSFESLKDEKERLQELAGELEQHRDWLQFDYDELAVEHEKIAAENQNLRVLLKTQIELNQELFKRPILTFFKGIIK